MPSKAAANPRLPPPRASRTAASCGRVLFLDQETPRPDRDAGSHAALVEMDLLQALGWKVTFLPLNLAWLAATAKTSSAAASSSSTPRSCSPSTPSCASGAGSSN